jgi:hypothetical protein
MSISRKRHGLSIKPFTGSPEQADENYLTHRWVEVPNPHAGTEGTGKFAITVQIPKTTLKCSQCNEWEASGAQRYPCGQAERD